MTRDTINRDLRVDPRRTVGSDKHCVFRAGQSWYSLAATGVREVIPAPDLVRVPHSHPALAGLCHFRSEFLPAIYLGPLLREAGAARFTEQKMIVLDGAAGAWALLVDEVVGLEPLETLTGAEIRSGDGFSTAVRGTASYRNHVVRVLDPKGLHRLAQDALENRWNEIFEPNRPSHAARGTDQ